MACRIRGKVDVGEKSVVAVALVNSGFEADGPDIVIPIELARELGLWPPRGSLTALLDTGGGEVATPYYPSAGTLRILLEDRETKPITVNLIVNPHVDEVLLSDYVAGELGIMLLDIRDGLSRLRDDHPGKTRRSVARGVA